MTTQKTTETSQRLKPASLSKWYRSPAKLMFALYLAASVGFLVPTVKSIIPIDDRYQSMAGETAGGDFSVFYTAGKLASDPDYNLGDLYHFHSFGNERRKIFANLEGGKLYFNYPPTALLLFTPFGKMSYMTAYSMWVLLLLTGTALTIHAFTKNKVLTAAALLSPAFLWCIITGQLGFLTTILMGSGLLMLQKEKPLSAGLLFGLLIFKPHLALALPIAFLATRQWRVIMGGIISTFGMILLSLIVFGPEVWNAFGTQFATNVTGHLLSMDNSIVERIPTIFVTTMHLSGNEILSSLLHIIGAIAAIWVTATIWRNSHDTTARLITLFVTPAFISPYYFDYDLTGLGLVFAILMVHVYKNKPKNSELLALCGIWVINVFMLLGKINMLFTGPVFLIGLLYYAFYRAQETSAGVNPSRA